MIGGGVTINVMAERWNLNPRTMQTMRAEGKIEGVTRFGNASPIPSDAKKPVDNRVVTRKYSDWRKKSLKGSE